MNQRKKILFISHWYPSEREPNKGVFIKNHAKVFNEISDLLVIDFSITHSNRIYKFSSLRENSDGMDVLHVRVESRFYKFIYYFIFFQKYLLSRSFKREKIEVDSFDLIVSNVIFPSGIVSWKLAKKYKKPIIHIEHWSNFRKFLEKDIHRFKGKRFLKYLSRLIVVSDILKETVQHFVPNDKITVIPNLVEPQFSFRPKDKNKEKINFLAIANWRAPKNPFEFLNALELLAMEQVIELTMIGKGPQLEKIRSMKWSFKINYQENMPQKELEKFYQEADFFLHGSDYETFSIVPIEALITGTPVIASRVGVLPEVINKENGLLCDNTVEEWKRCILTAIKTDYDHQHISDSIKYRFSAEVISSKFESVINDLELI